MSTAELKLNGTTIISESGGTATLQNTTLDSGVTIPSNLDIEAASKTAFNATGNAPVYACRAWISFNQTDGSINGSGNIANISSTSTGYWYIEFDVPMEDDNYAVLGTGQGGGTTGSIVYLSTKSVNGFYIYTRDLDDNGTTDRIEISLAVFR